MTELKVVRLPSIVGPWVSPWRHPRIWWKTRHLRADILEEERRLNADPLARELRARLTELESHAFLFGDADEDLGH
jgi:hypothetical protein